MKQLIFIALSFFYLSGCGMGQNLSYKAPTYDVDGLRFVCHDAECAPKFETEVDFNKSILDKRSKNELITDYTGVQIKHTREKVDNTDPSNGTITIIADYVFADGESVSHKFSKSNLDLEALHTSPGFELPLVSHQGVDPGTPLNHKSRPHILRADVRCDTVMDGNGYCHTLEIALQYVNGSKLQPKTDSNKNVILGQDGKPILEKVLTTTISITTPAGDEDRLAPRKEENSIAYAEEQAQKKRERQERAEEEQVAHSHTAHDDDDKEETEPPVIDQSDITFVIPGPLNQEGYVEVEEAAKLRREQAESFPAPILPRVEAPSVALPDLFRDDPEPLVQEHQPIFVPQREILVPETIEQKPGMQNVGSYKEYECQTFSKNCSDTSGETIIETVPAPALEPIDVKPYEAGTQILEEMLPPPAPNDDTQSNASGAKGLSGLTTSTTVAAAEMPPTSTNAETTTQVIQNPPLTSRFPREKPLLKKNPSLLSATPASSQQYLHSGSDSLLDFKALVSAYPEYLSISGGSNPKAQIKVSLPQGIDCLPGNIGKNFTPDEVSFFPEDLVRQLPIGLFNKLQDYYKDYLVSGCFDHAKGSHIRGRLSKLATPLPKIMGVPSTGTSRADHIASESTKIAMTWVHNDFYRKISGARPSIQFYINDVSMKNGGQLARHGSHQNGLDVDISYPYLNQENPQKMQGESWVAPNTWMLSSLAERSLPYLHQYLKSLYSLDGKVAAILTDKAIKTGLCLSDSYQSEPDHEFKSWVDKKFMHWEGHEDHMHIRFNCGKRIGIKSPNPNCTTAAISDSKMGCRELIAAYERENSDYIKHQGNLDAAPAPRLNPKRIKYPQEAPLPTPKPTDR